MLTHNNVLITGASRGIGRAAALQFARCGFGVIITGCHHKEALEQTKAEILKLQVPCLSFAGDLSQPETIELLFSEMENQNMIPDLVINNAGIAHIGLLQDMSYEEWNRVMNTNMTAAFGICRKIIPYFLHKGEGRIINISSVWGNVGASCEVAYSASKGALNSFTRALAKELAPSHIAVNALACGAVDTEMNHQLSPEERRDLEDSIPFGRMASPEEAARTIYYLSQCPLYLTGQVLTMDGGWI